MPDIVISDIRMPRFDGISLLKRIRQVERNVIVIMVTAHGNEEIALKALQSGANNYLKKPINLDEFRSQLARYKSILDYKIRKLDISNLIQSQKLEICVDSDMDYIPILSEFLTQKIKHVFSPSVLINIELGISELLLNAIEHGNYNITNTDKKKALLNNTLVELYNERKQIADSLKKKIHITFTQNTEYCEWVVKDDGDGFDWKNLPHPTSQQLSTELQGRGVFISKLQFDDVQFLGSGNVVSAKKYFS
ncbi:MAG: response regulator [Bacteroidota bacterium]